MRAVDHFGTAKSHLVKVLQYEKIINTWLILQTESAKPKKKKLIFWASNWLLISVSKNMSVSNSPKKSNFM